MIIRINEEDKTISLDNGSTEEYYWYDLLVATEQNLTVYRGLEVMMVIPLNYGIIIYENAE